MAERTAILIDSKGEFLGTASNPLYVEGITAVASLVGLTDVQVASLESGDGLFWDEELGAFVNAPASAGGGGSSAILPTHRGCLVEFNDSFGGRIKDADSDAYVPAGLHVQSRGAGFLGKYHFKSDANLMGSGFAGVVDITHSVPPSGNPECSDWNHINAGLVINMVDQMILGQIGIGMFIWGHGNYAALAIKRPDDVNGTAFITFQGDQVIPRFPLGINSLDVNIDAGQTYNIGGVPHNHDSRYLQLAGGMMQGSINMTGSRIVGLSDPILGSEPVTKDFISALVAGVSWRDAVDLISPSSPEGVVYGTRILVASNNTVAPFVGHENDIATWSEFGWSYETPEIGWAVLNIENTFAYAYGTTGWVQFSGGNNHGSLIGLQTNDDHTQYVHINTSRTISAVHSFVASTVPFEVSCTNLVSNLNANYLDGSTKSDFALATHIHNISSLAGVTISSPVEGDSLVYDSATGKFVNRIGAGTLALDSRYIFEDNDDRDAYFAASEHSAELVNGLFIAVASGFQQYDAGVWRDKTAVLKGSDGIDGVDGKDGASGPAGPQGGQGVQGIQGIPGSQGLSIELKGSVALHNDLPMVGNTVNDVYYCVEDQHCYIWGSDGYWIDAGILVGQEGPAGPQGVQGLQGEQGIPGEQGPVGETGPAGQDGHLLGFHANYTEKTALVNADIFILEDSEAEWDKKWVSLETLKSIFGTSESGGGGISWESIASSVVAVPDTGYIANSDSLVTITLPATCAVGKVIRVSGVGIGGWKVAQNADQKIVYSDRVSYTGSEGFIQSMHYRDCVELLCVVANTEFQVISSVGTLGLNMEV